MKSQLGIALLCTALVVETVLSAVITDPIAEIKQGKIKGRVGESRNGRKYSAFLGIPYAKKPLRFQEAGPPEKWDQPLRDGTRFGSPCIQTAGKTKDVIGAEDCLFLNVYTPVAVPSTTTTPAPPTTPKSKTAGSPIPPVPPPRSASRKLPVIVYLHGGNFNAQSGQIFGPQYFMDQDVVLVTVNYRLGVFGFLSTGDTDSISNLGLRDLVLSLKWVQENVEKFGGDPAKVTLMGGSSGGILASYLMVSPMAKGLFSRVISQSGNALCPWGIVRNPKKVAEKLAGKLNCPGKSSKEIISCIKGKGLKDIELARAALGGFGEDPAVPFAPVVEKWVTTKDKAVVPDSPQKLFAAGNGAHIPWLTGYNSLNGINLPVATILTTPKRVTQVDQEWGKLAPLLFHYSQSAPNPAAVSEAVRQYYFGKGRISEENKDKLAVALTDRNFVSCTADAALAQSKFAPVYLYTMNYQGEHSFLDEWEVGDKIKMRGVVQNDELPYLFKLSVKSFPELKKGDKHTPFSEKLIKLWTEFAKDGKAIEKSAKGDFEWSSVLPSQTTSNLKWYQLDSAANSQAVTIPAPTFKVWEGLDLGPDETFLRNQQNGGKMTVGYTITDKPVVKPITMSHPAPAKQPLPLSPTQKPLASPTLVSASANQNPSPGSGGLAYGLAPNAASQPSPAPIQKPLAAASSPTPTAKPTVAPKPTSASPAKQTASETPAPAAPIGGGGGGVFNDDDRFSSTSTTTTTKKPGFFSKIIG